MFCKFKRLIIVTMVAAALATLAPVTANAAVAVAPCQGKVAFVGVQEWHQTVLLTGEYTSAGATDVRLTCGVVRQGVTVARLSENVPGPVAALAGTVTVLAGDISICYELNVTYLDRPATVSDTCP